MNKLKENAPLIVGLAVIFIAATVAKRASPSQPSTNIVSINPLPRVDEGTLSAERTAKYEVAAGAFGGLTELAGLKLTTKTQKKISKHQVDIARLEAQAQVDIARAQADAQTAQAKAQASAQKTGGLFGLLRQIGSGILSLFA